MKQQFNVLPKLLITLCLTLLISTPLCSEPPNLSLVRKEIINYYDTGLYYKDLENKIKQAQQYIIDQAKIHKHDKSSKKLALVLDIDETSLSNYDKMVKRNFVGTKEEIHQEIMAANAVVIKPMLDLYNTALKHNIKVFFVTGRHESERDATRKNLINAGYKKWSGLYLRPNNYPYPSIIPFKSKARETITNQGYTIIASIGDQFSDIRGGYAEKGFKLPNPFYYLP
ncbi:HAD family acid phosphatase [Legionella bononiensis]|uniref:Acid phosphatase n=1 Tax=Legionella bononiensis TaxID=2793102 RepID=A0ABS1WA70_9GAMM|nr:HAD family acid phosphatase [Legionella bononiensis]MBL7480522.1 acid phosphatase [Legionella bononiensis]MBL7526239.1 acid phosphatase [Legionella bononiensis]MBL7563266.1 acid phosphatase [Legionella bononiensis]